MRSLLPMFDDFFMDDGWDSFFDNAPAMRNRISVPRVDIEDKEDHYEVVADFPGLPRIRFMCRMNMVCSLWKPTRITARKPMTRIRTFS